MLKLLLLLLSASLALAQESAVTEISVKTMEESDAQMTLGSIDVTINCNPRNGLDFCTAEELDGSGNDFQQGDINYFEVSRGSSYCSRFGVFF